MAGFGISSYPRGLGEEELSTDDDDDFVYAIEDDAYTSYKKRTIKELNDGASSDEDESLDLEGDGDYGDFQELDK